MQGDSQVKLVDYHPQDLCTDTDPSLDLPTYPPPPSIDCADLPPYPLVPENAALVGQSAGVDDSLRCPQRGAVAPILERTDRQGSS